MVPPPRVGSFSPNPSQTLQTGTSHSPHPSHGGVLSAGASPSTSSPTGANPLTKIVVAQVYLLLSTIKEDKDRARWELQVEQLHKVTSPCPRKLIQETLTANSLKIISSSMNTAWKCSPSILLGW